MEDHLDAFDDLLGTGLDPVDPGTDAGFADDQFDLHAGLQPLDDRTVDVNDIGLSELDAAVQDFPIGDDHVTLADSAPAPASAGDDDDPWSAAFLT